MLRVGIGPDHRRRQIAHPWFHDAVFYSRCGQREPDGRGAVNLDPLHFGVQRSLRRGSGASSCAERVLEVGPHGQRHVAVDAAGSQGPADHPLVWVSCHQPRSLAVAPDDPHIPSATRMLGPEW